MATYKVVPGDSLSKIASKLGLKSWQDLYNQNKSVVGSNPNLIYPGQVLTYGSTAPASSSSGSSSTSTKTTTTVVPSQQIGTTLAEPVSQMTRDNFIKKYGTEDVLRPDAIFRAVAEERVNPEMLREATAGVVDYDRAFNRGGGYLSGRMQLARQGYINSLERARKEAYNTYIQSQNQLFNEWYNKEMEQYMNSKAPSEYTMKSFGVEVPSTLPEYDSGKQYEYTPAMDISSLFKYGGYAAPASMYNMPTVVG